MCTTVDIFPLKFSHFFIIIIAHIKAKQMCALVETLLWLNLFYMSDYLREMFMAPTARGNSRAIHLIRVTQKLSHLHEAFECSYFWP